MHLHISLSLAISVFSCSLHSLPALPLKKSKSPLRDECSCPAQAGRGISGGLGEGPLCSCLLGTLAGRDGVWDVVASPPCADAGL